MQYYVGDLVNEVRRDSRNEDEPSVSEEQGISTNDILRHLNYGQEGLQNKILREYPHHFQYRKIIQIEANTSEYEIPDNVFLGTRIVKVEYAPQNYAERDWCDVPVANKYHYNREGGASKFGFFRSNGNIYLVPEPDTSEGWLRVTYERTLDRLDVRRGTVTERTLSSTQLTALTIDTASDDVTAIDAADYICVVDKYGNVQMYNIPITSYDDSTGVFTLDAFTFVSGETVSVGDYIVCGKYTTTHSGLHDSCARYLVLYATEFCYRRDSSQDLTPTAIERRSIEKDILQGYEVPDKTVKDFPIVFDDPLIGDGGW